MTTPIIRDVREFIVGLSLEQLLDMRDQLPQDGDAIVTVRLVDERTGQPIIVAPGVALADESDEPLTADEARELLTTEAWDRAKRSMDLDLAQLMRISDSAIHEWWQSDAADRLIAEEAEAAGLTREQLDAALQQGLPDGATTREVARGAVERCTPIEEMDHVELREFVETLFTVPDASPDTEDEFDAAREIYDRIQRRAVEIIQGADSWTEAACAADALAGAAMEMADASWENAR